MEAKRIENLPVPTYRFNHQGLEVFVAETGKLGCIAQICVRAGALQDGRYPGRAHYIEHLKSHGTGRDDIHPRLRKLVLSGVEKNAGTSRVSTMYYVNGLSDQLPEMVQGLIPLCLDDEIDAEFVELERGVVIQEARQHEAGDGVASEVNRVIFPENPELHHGLGGTRNSLRAMTYDALRAFTDNYYVARNTALFVAGGVTCAQVAEALEKVKVKQDQGELPRLAEPSPKLIRTTIERESFSDGIHVFFEGTRDKDERIALSVACDLLAKPPLGLLHQRLRTADRSIYGVRPTLTKYDKLLSLLVNSVPSKFNRIEEAIFHETSRLGTMDYPKDVFEYVMGSRCMAWEKRQDSDSNARWVGFLQDSWLEDDYDDYLELSLKVTREQVADVARKYFRRDQYGCLHIFKKRDW